MYKRQILSFHNTDKYLKEELHGILTEFGFETAEELSAAAEEYAAACAGYEEAKEKCTAATHSFLSAGSALKNGEETALNGVKKVFPGISSVETAVKAVEDAEKLLNMLSRAEAFALSAQNVSEALREDFEGSLDEEMEFVQKPLRSREDTRAALERTEEKIRELSKEYNVLCGQARAKMCIRDSH